MSTPVFSPPNAFTSRAFEKIPPNKAVDVDVDEDRVRLLYMG